jgi:hypothetical protein
MREDVKVPDSIRAWFVVHFVVDILFAVPLLVTPKFTLSLLGWTTIDPLATRLVAAALMGIGGESLLGRGASTETYRAMLNLKIIWSLGAVVGIGLSMAAGGPAMGWAILVIFAAFCALWTCYRFRLRGHEK